MKYQLVLQWTATSIEDYDTMIALEDDLVEKLSNKCEVDGHDFGSGTTNIFIHTNDPNEAFMECVAVLWNRGMKDLRAAYRAIDGDQYTILFPENLSQFTII
jgi:hypothetical protein